MRKTIVLTGATLLLAVSLLLSTGCSSPVQSREDPASMTGTVTLTIGDNLARTILPDAGAGAFAQFRLTFVDAGAVLTDVVELVTTATPAAIPLGQATWNLTVEAFTTADDFTTLAAQGTSTGIVVATANVNVTVPLNPVSDPLALGTFAWVIDLSDITGFTSATISFLNLDGGANPSDVTLPATPIQLAPGNYRVTLTIYHPDYGYLIVTEVLQIFSNLTSTWTTEAFAPGDFYVELVDFIIGALGGLSTVGISQLHFALLTPAITMNADQFGNVNIHAPTLSGQTGGMPTNVAELAVLVDAAQVMAGAATASILMAAPAGRAAAVDALLVGSTAVTVANWLLPTVTAAVGVYSVPFNFYYFPGGAVIIDGTLNVNDVLEANITAIGDFTGSVAFSGATFQWQRTTTPAVAGSWTNIPLATGSAHTLVADDSPGYIRVLVSHDSFGENRASDYVGPIVDPVGGSATVAITLPTFTDVAPAVTIGDISITAAPTTISITGEAAVIASATWFLNGTVVGPGGASLELTSAILGTRMGRQSLTVTVTAPTGNFSRRVYFNVIP